MTEKNWFKWVQFAASIFAMLFAGSGGVPMPNVTFGKPTTPPTVITPPAPVAPMPQQLAPAADVREAIGQISFPLANGRGSAGCTATVIYPALGDGRYLVLTAAHCVEGTSSVGKMKLRNGKVFSVEVANKDKQSDCCWLRTVEPQKSLPMARLASTLPAKGDKVLHAGFGVDNPGNTEYGEVIQPDNGAGQTQFNLSVSHGDSGGGIALNSKGEIVSCVCCTSRLNGKGAMWGANVVAIRKAIPKVNTSVWTWEPVEMPVREESSAPVDCR